MNKSQAIYHALLTVPDPEEADTKRLLAIARARLEQAGEDPKDLEADYIPKIKSKIRVTKGSLTHQSIRDYLSSMSEQHRPKDATNGKTSHKPIPDLIPDDIGEPYPPEPAPALSPNTLEGLSNLKKAKEFVEFVGGVSNALFLVKAWGELTRD